MATGEMEVQPRKVDLARPLPGCLWVWTRGTHNLGDSVRFLCACTQRTHLLRGAGTSSALSPVLPAQGPSVCGQEG